VLIKLFERCIYATEEKFSRGPTERLSNLLSVSDFHVPVLSDTLFFSPAFSDHLMPELPPSFCHPYLIFPVKSYKSETGKPPGGGRYIVLLYASALPLALNP